MSIERASKALSGKQSDKIHGEIRTKKIYQSSYNALICGLERKKKKKSIFFLNTKDFIPSDNNKQANLKTQSLFTNLLKMRRL